MHLRSWQSAAKKLTPNTYNGRAILNVFSVSLKYIYTRQYIGGCHDTSAAIYILLSELGLAPKLYVGEVKYDQCVFDHSWVELDDKIFDAAICIPMPNTVGVPSSSVFASIDLTTGKKPNSFMARHQRSGTTTKQKLLLL